MGASIVTARLIMAAYFGYKFVGLEEVGEPEEGRIWPFRRNAFVKKKRKKKKERGGDRRQLIDPRSV
jgi:hypothetical protein